MNRPMKMLHLEAQRQRLQMPTLWLPAYAWGWIQAYPLAILRRLAVWRVGMMGASSIVTVWTVMMLARLLLARPTESELRLRNHGFHPGQTSDSDLMSKHV